MLATFTVNAFIFFFLLPAEINDKHPHRLVQIIYGNVITESTHSSLLHYSSHKARSRFIIPLKIITIISPTHNTPRFGIRAMILERR